MKTFFISLFILLAFGFSSSAQNVITVQNGNKVQFYASLDSAYVHVSDGDTLYLPGGSYGSLTISKNLTIIGVGHNPDSTKATGKTLLSGLILNTGADNGSVTGIYFSGSIVFNSEVNGYTINRCYIGNSIGYSLPLSNGGSKIGVMDDIIILDLNLSKFSNCLVSNNLISGVTNAVNSEVKNNIFLNTNNSSYPPNSLYANNCTVENNIFGYFGYETNCVLNNNINDDGRYGTGGNQVNGNYMNVEPFHSIFVNYDSTSMTFQNIYKADFHLVSDSPYKNAGTDGTAIGIYGGTFPWKVGSIPYNPHIKINSVAGTTDANGNLKVNITVEAQGH